MRQTDTEKLTGIPFIRKSKIINQLSEEDIVILSAYKCSLERLIANYSRPLKNKALFQKEADRVEEFLRKNL